jgi:hypothetical protein
MKYLKALSQNIGPATFDVAFIASVSLIPLILARLTPLVNGKELRLADGWLWQLLTNGQLAFYALGTLAAIGLVAFKGDVLPKALRLFFGAVTTIALIFVAYLIGVDPMLTAAGKTFVGVTCFWIYVGTQVMAICVGSFERFGPGSALRAGDASARTTAADLASRKGAKPS